MVGILRASTTSSSCPTLRSRPTSPSEFFVGYKVEEHVPGYTGFIPRIQNDFAHTYSAATRAVLRWPPTTEVHNVEFNHRANKRVVRANCPPAAAGFSGFNSRPQSECSNYGTAELDYVQGAQVSVEGYYEDQARRVNALKKSQPKLGLLQQKTIRNMSQISFGDNFYYSGKHMYATTTKEAFSPENLPNPIASDLVFPTTRSSSPGRIRPRFGFEESQEEESQDYQYIIAQAIVGPARLDDLWKRLGERIRARVITGNANFMEFFNMSAYASSTGQSVIGPKEFLAIAHKLGVAIREREALALFGRADARRDRRLSYADFTNFFFRDEEERTLFQQNERNVQRVLGEEPTR